MKTQTFTFASEYNPPESENAKTIISQMQEYGGALHIDLWYPRVETNPVKFIQLALMDVRAADDIRISYDYERDGYKIEQASRFRWPADDPVCDPDWQEVAFIQAWAREKKDFENPR